MRAVDLAEGATGIDEQHLVAARLLGLSFVKKPQGAGKSDRIEKVRSDRHDNIDGAAFDQLLTDFQFGAAGIARRICHHEACATVGSERSVE